MEPTQEDCDSFADDTPSPPRNCIWIIGLPEDHLSEDICDCSEDGHKYRQKPHDSVERTDEGINRRCHQRDYDSRSVRRDEESFWVQ